MPSEQNDVKNVKHGLSRTTEYNSWICMMARCYRLRNCSYPNYGGAGIVVCERWHDFRNFLDDMGLKPTRLHTIHRIKSDQNYKPSNCAWADKKTQSNSVKTNRILTHNGKSQTMMQWCREIGMLHPTLSSRLRRGVSIPEALTSPVIKDPRYRRFPAHA